MPQTRTRKTQNRQRPMVQLPEALNTHLRNYADGARGVARTDSTWLLSGVRVSAVGLGMLALPQLATAEVVYTPANQSINEQARRLQIDFNNDGVIDASLYVGGYCFIGSGNRDCYGSIFANGLQGNQVVTSGGYASAAKPGKIIGHQDKFEDSPQMAFCRSGSNAINHSSWRTLKGPWLDVQHRYLGFKFKINGATHYGWARITTSGFPCYPSAHLTGYAYETVANRPIIAGVEAEQAALQMGPLDKGPAAAEQNVDYTSLGMLAVGAPGLAIWRKRSGNEASLL
jgi:hypothetical protein